MGGFATPIANLMCRWQSPSNGERTASADLGVASLPLLHGSVTPIYRTISGISGLLGLVDLLNV